MSNLWELEEAQKALQKHDYMLCSRYVEKALERVRCMYCHKGLYYEEGPNASVGEPYRPHFKGFVHLSCAEKYNGRSDYLRQHGNQ